MPVVAVEIAPAEADPELVRALVTACSSSVAIGHCVIRGSERDDAVDPSAVAIVSWQTNAEVRVEVGARRAARARWLTQRLSFRHQDLESERWRAVGLAIGTLVGEIDDPRNQPPGQLPPDSRRPERDDGAFVESEQSTRPVERSVWLDAGFVAGPATDRGDLRTGVVLRSFYEPRGSWVFGSLSASYAWRPIDAAGAKIEWSNIGLGLGHAFGSAAHTIGAELRADAVFEYVRVSATDRDTGRSGSAHTWVGGLRLGLTGHFMAFSPLGVMAGVELSALSADVDVRVRDVPAGTVPAINFAAVAGARIRLD